METTPTGISLTDRSRLRIAWSDGSARVYSLAELQAACQCANCRHQSAPAESATKPGELPVLSVQEAQPLALLGAKPVGNYAYSFHFNHGCSRGIYRFDYLRQLGTPEEQAI